MELRSTVAQTVGSQGKILRPLTRSFPLNASERRVLLALGDAAGAGSAYEAVRLVWKYVIHRPAAPGVFGLLLFIAGCLLALYLVDGYDVQIPASRVRSLAVILKATGVGCFVGLLFFLLLPPSRATLDISIMTAVLAITLTRLTVARGLLRETFAKRAVLVGSLDGPVMSRTLYNARYDYHLFGSVCDMGPADESLRRLGGIEELPEIVERYGVDEVILAERDPDRGSRAAEVCMATGIHVTTPMQLAERYQQRVPLAWIDRDWFLSLPPRDLYARPYLVVRRLADIAMSLLIGIPFLLLLPLIALLIKIDSHGPVLVVQARLGQFGHPFRLIKLRTMVVDAERDGHRWTTRSDPRITRMGRILRTTRIDEVPQVLNVLRGEMSFIGPRPERPEFATELEQSIRHYRTRMAVKPGISGWAQVKDGYAASVEDSARKLEFDLFYVKYQCLRLDLQIAFHTVFTILGVKGR